MADKRLRQSELLALSCVREALELARMSLGHADGPLSLVLAVSGGEDSAALLHLLHRLRAEAWLKLHIAHFDHALRPESVREANFVRGLAKKYNLPFYERRAVTRPVSENMEAWARRVRYEFLEDVRRQTKSWLIVTAHHLNDQAETVLFRLLNGRYSTDATGIAELDLSRRVFRPLLRVKKSEIEDYVSLHLLSFVVDPTNADFERTRNRIRAELLPQLEKQYNPQLVTHLGVFAARSSEDERFLLEKASEVRQSLPARPTGEELRGLPPALLWRVILLIAAEQVGAEAEKIGYRTYWLVAEALEKSDNQRRRFDLGFGIRCELSRNASVKFFRAVNGVHLAAANGPVEPAKLIVPGVVERKYPDGSSASITAGVLVLNEEVRDDVRRVIDWTKKRASNSNSDRFAVEYFDLERLPSSTLLVRERENGDAMRVWRRGERKLKKLFLEHEVDVEVRNQVPLVQSGEDILWVPGVARSAMAPIAENSRYVLELRYERNSASS